MNQDLMNRIQAMMQQRGASGNGIMGYASGGGVPRETMIGGQPHMLAYINPEEEDMLQDYRQDAPTVPGPGGIPSFFSFFDRGSNTTNTSNSFGGGSTYSGSGSSVSGGRGYTYEQPGERASYLAANHPTDNDDSTPSGPSAAQIAAQQAAAQQAAAVAAAQAQAAQDAANAAIVAQQQQAAAEAAAIAQAAAQAEAEAQAQAQAQAQAEADARAKAIAEAAAAEAAAQAAREQAAQVAAAQAAQAAREQAEREQAEALAAQEAQRVEAQRLADEQAERERIQASLDAAAVSNVGQGRPTSFASEDTQVDYDAFGDPVNPALVGGDAVPQVDTTAEAFRANEQRIAQAAGFDPVDSLFDDQDEVVEQALSASELAMSELLGGNAVRAGINLRGPDGSESTPKDITQAAMGSELQNIKNRIHVVEGTDDDGGYDRLLGGQENNFGVKPTNMTVQEVLDFQSQRGDGTYAGYSQGVNEGRNFLREDGTGQISTPVGKYQVVGSNLKEMIKLGVIDANAKFDEATQEKIGDYLITQKRGYDDYVNGDITLAQFEKGLGNEFEGIAIQGLGDISVGDPIDNLILEASATGGSRDGYTPEEIAQAAELGIVIGGSSSESDEIDDLIVKASAVTDGDDLQSKVSIDPTTGNMINNETGEVIMQASSLADFRGDGTGGESATNAQALAALDYYTTGAGADGATQPMYSKEETAEIFDRIKSGGESLTDQESATIFGDTQRTLDQIDFTREDREAYMEDLIDGYAAQEGIPTEAEINGETTELTPAQRLAAVRALKTKNTTREDLANFLTPSDGAEYINGQLVDSLTGESLEGGGYTVDPETGEKDYIYGVSDDFTNNTDVDTTGMSERDAMIAKAKQQLVREVPPNDLAYFASFVPSIISPIGDFGLGAKFLSGGIEERRANLEKEIAALKGGAEPRYDDDGNYIGHTASEDQLANTFGSGNIFNDGTTFNDDGSVKEPGDSIEDFGLDQSNTIINDEELLDLVELPVEDPPIFDPPIFEPPIDDPPEDEPVIDEPVIDEPVVDTGYTTDADGNIVCNEIGYIYNKASNVCVPIGDVSGGSLGDREIRERKDVTPRDKTTGDTSSVTFRKPKFFADGGSVTPNIDSFFSNLR